MRKIVVTACLWIAGGLAAFGLINAADHGSTRFAATATSVMLQAMERGYQCRAAGRHLDDCQQEQRLRWANPTDLPPFGSKP